MTVQISSTPPEQWNDWINALAGNQFTLYHREVWAERLKSVRGYDPLYLSIMDGETFLGLVLAAEIRPLKLRLPREIAYYTFKSLKSRSLGQLTWYAEPVTREDKRDQVLAEIAAAIENYVRKNHLKVANAHWPAEHVGSLPDSWISKKWATLTVDCSRDDNSLPASFKPAARKAIRRATEDGIVVRQIENIEQMREYYSFARQCSRRYGKKLAGFEDFENLFTEVRSRSIFETFVAEKDGEPLAGLSVWGDGNFIQELGSFNSERAFREKLYGADLLKWEIIRWARANGIRWFDLAGINPDPTDSKEENIRRFKEKWGGHYSEYLLVSSK